ncbi:MAG TPA: pyridoxamine 5'-phosphate oxidase [Gemmatimonadaceae bacterium]|nr:pyridoxamine 5'-phosphate oxidase [Gemmatimonadaceae bacterium]
MATTAERLGEEERADDPIDRFRSLLAEAEAIDRSLLPEPTAMMLATVGDDGQPSLRVVLLKSVDERGFVFYTNYESRKGRELLAHPKAALCFHWQPLERQVRIEGEAEPVAPEEADAYFATRARLSQIGAWASNQSRPLANDDELDARVREMEKRFAGGAVPRPPHWSGFRVVPRRIEFWRNRAFRLHERLVYEREEKNWRVTRLYP